MSNNKQPTYEELLAMFKKEQAKVAEEQAKNSELLIKVKEQENYIAKFKEVISPIIADTLLNTSIIANQLNKYVFNLDDVLIKDVLEQIEFTAKQTSQWANLAKTYFENTPFAPTGSDINGNTPAKGEALVTQAKEEQKEVAASFNNSIKDISKTNILMKKAIDLATQQQGKENSSEAQKAVIKNNDIQPKARKAKATTKLKGRVSKPRNPVRTISASNNQSSCDCGGTITSIGSIAQKLYTYVNKAQQLLQDSENLHDVYICQKCGHVHVAISDNQDVPVVPNRQISCETCIDLAYANVNGIPLNKMVSALCRIKGFGNDTFYYNMHDFAQIYIEPLFKQIEAAAKKAKVIQVDETPFACLGAQGKRKERDNSNAVDGATTEKQINSKNYILALTAPRFASEQFCLYYYMKNRSKDSLKELISDDYCFNTICTDGYSGYDALLKDSHPNTKHQSCLIHFRREVIKAINPKGFAQEILKLDTPSAIAKLAKDFKEDNPIVLMFNVLDALSKIYSYESSMSGTTEADFKDRVECRTQGPVRKLMDNIDVIMKSLSVGRVELKGSSYIKAKADPFAKACVYYMNNRDKLRTFLDDGSVQADTNLVEGCIRPLTILRKTIYHKVSQEYSKDMAMTFSVFQTAARVGIDDIHSFLKDYCHDLYKYCFEKQWTQAYKDGVSLDKQIKTWDMKKLSEGFDFEKWNLTNYKKSK